MIDSIKELNEGCNAWLYKEAEYVARLEDVISGVKQYEELIMTQRKNYWIADQARVHFLNDFKTLIFF